MIQTAQNHATSSKQSHLKGVDLSEILSINRVAVALPVSSKKKLLESVTTLLLKDTKALNENTVMRILIERERLGSTGIGNGVAVPHGRVSGLSEPIGAFATLAQPVDFDAIDRQPVTMVFALLVPAQATEKHLQIIAWLAAMFSDPKFRDALQHDENAEELYAGLTAWNGLAADTP